MAKLSMLETPQQLLRGEYITPEVEYKLGRACTAHSFAAARELIDNSYEVDNEAFVSMVLEHGAGTGSEYYREGIGWSIIALADDIRAEGFSAISQNLIYDFQTGDFDKAVQGGRVRTNFEKSRLNILMEWGGADRTTWVEALRHTTTYRGVVIASLEIPLLDGSGYGRHAVVVTEVDDTRGILKYFDSDMYCTRRYGSVEPEIVRLDQEKLLYQRPIKDFIQVMTGEAVHILPPQS